MLYHRLLVELLNPHFDWAAFWKRVGVKTSAQLSDTFLKQAFLVPSPTSEDAAQSGTTSQSTEDVYVGFPRTLDDLVDSLLPAVDAVITSAPVISNTLEIVYRAQKARRKGGGQSAKRAQEELEAGLRLKPVPETEDLDLQRAITASLAEHSGSGFGASGMGVSFDAVMPSLSDVMPPLGGTTLEHGGQTLEHIEDKVQGDSEGGMIDGHLARTLNGGLGEMAWAVQEAAVTRVGPNEVGALADARTAEDEGERAVDYLQASAQEAAVETVAKPLLGRSGDADGADSDSESEDQVVEEDSGGKAGRIIGTRKFEMDDLHLDAHLDRVIGWWMGTREPEGVPVELSKRCLCVISSILSSAQTHSFPSTAPANIEKGASGEKPRHVRLLSVSACFTRRVRMRRARRVRLGMRVLV